MKIMRLGICGVLLTLMASAYAAAYTPPANVEPGIRLRLAEFEILAADTTEMALIDSLAVDVRMERETTLRIGNATMQLTALPLDSQTVRLQYSLFISGPVVDNRFDDVVVEYGAPLVVDSLRGKGKSTYRILIAPYPAAIHPGTGPRLHDSTAWEVLPNPYYYFYLPPGELARFHFLPLSNVLQAEYAAIRDTFAFVAPGKTIFYLVDESPDEFPLDPQWHFALDPARNWVVALNDERATGVDLAAMLMVQLYRWWGYAPDLLAVGVADYRTFADYAVREDRRAGHAIPLDSLIRTVDFRRHDRAVARHHAASFVQWLIHRHGVTSFRKLYDRATDLSLARAVWSVYGHTLAELEKAWLADVEHRTFTSDEVWEAAARARVYRRYDEYVSLLKYAARLTTPPQEALLEELGLAQAHLGQWVEATSTFTRLTDLRPDTSAYQWLLAEAYRAQGNDAAAAQHLREVHRRDTADAGVFLRWGDMQYEQRREDSAATLWHHGLDIARGTHTTAELLLRLGRHEKSRRATHAAATERFMQVFRLAAASLKAEQGTPDGWIIAGEALLGLDSLTTAEGYFHAARYVADAPVDIGRATLGLGACYDLQGRRADAVQEYERVLASSATEPDRRAARRYINQGFRF